MMAAGAAASAGCLGFWAGTLVFAFFSDAIAEAVRESFLEPARAAVRKSLARCRRFISTSI
jgi:hypothetical protein